MFLGYPVEPKVAVCSKFLHFQLDFELHYMCTYITLVLACKQAHKYYAISFPEAAHLLYSNGNASSAGQE